jgi:hypothetical protein
MKNAFYLFIIIFILINKKGISQIVQVDQISTSNQYILVSGHFGYDFPTINNKLDFLNYTPNYIGGGKYSQFWSWYGFGIDFDYTTTGVKSTYPVDSKFFLNDTTLLTTYDLNEKSIRRIQIGIGPDFKLDVNNKVLLIEAGFRLGISTFKGGQVELRETTTILNETLLFHAGYNSNILFTSKARFSIGFFPKGNNVGFSLGAYYIKHYNVVESKSISYGKSAFIHTYTKDNISNSNRINGTVLSRTEACNCEASSYGGFISLNLRMNNK